MATLGQINAAGGKYMTPEAINRALAAGAGDGPGQIHVDDWLQNNQNPNDFGDASMLLYGPDKGNVNGGTYDENGNQTAASQYQQQMLQQALKFDPNAHMVGNTYATWDQSLMPKFVGGDTSKLGAPGDSLVSLQTDNAGGRVIDPSQIINDPHYGAYVARGNLQQSANDAAGGGIAGAITKYMPSVVGGVMSMATGGLMSPQLISAIGNAADGQKTDIGKLLLSLAGNYAIGQVPGLMNAAGMTGITSGMDTIMPWLNKGMTAYQLAQQAQQAAHGNTGAQVGTGFTLGKLFNQYGLNGGGG